MTSNPLVATPGPDHPDAWEGIYLAQDIEQIAGAIRNQSWVDGAIGGLSLGLDGLAAYSDPIGTVLSGLASWAMEHIGPLREALNQLAGDVGQINAHAQTWRNIAGALAQTTQEHGAAVTGELADWTGTSASAYRTWASQQGGSLSALASVSQTMAEATVAAGMVVAVVRQIVRDAIADCIARAITYTAELAYTAGLATPLVVEQFTTFVAAKANRIAHQLHGLIRSIRALSQLLHKLEPALEKIEQILGKLRKGSEQPHGGGPPEGKPEAGPGPVGGGGSTGKGSAPPLKKDTAPPPEASAHGDARSVTARMRALKGKAKQAEWVSPKQEIPGEVERGPGLRAHFDKHGAEVGAGSAREYDLSARETIQNGRRFFYRDRATNDPRVGYWDPGTGLFTATTETRGTPVILTHFAESWAELRKLPGFTGR